MPRDAIAYPTPHRQAQDARILAALAVEPLCNRGLAEVIGMGRTGAAKYTERLRAEKRIHICGHTQPLTGGYPRPLYAPGDKPDAVYEPKVPKSPKITFDRRAKRIERIVAAMTKPATSRQIAEACYMDVATVHEYFAIMRESGTHLHIRRWTQYGKRNAWVPVYALGKRENAPRPATQTRAERYQQYRADPEVVERINANRRHRRRLDGLKQKPAGIFAALGV